MRSSLLGWYFPPIRRWDFYYSKLPRASYLLREMLTIFAAGIVILFARHVNALVFKQCKLHHAVICPGLEFEDESCVAVLS